MNTNVQTIHQFGAGITKIVKQATGREDVGNIDMEFVSVAQAQARAAGIYHFIPTQNGTPSSENPIYITPGLVFERDNGDTVTAYGGYIDAVNRVLTINVICYTSNFVWGGSLNYARVGQFAINHFKNEIESSFMPLSSHFPFSQLPLSSWSEHVDRFRPMNTAGNGLSYFAVSIEGKSASTISEYADIVQEFINSCDPPAEFCAELTDGSSYIQNITLSDTELQRALIALGVYTRSVRNVRNSPTIEGDSIHLERDGGNNETERNETEGEEENR